MLKAKARKSMRLLLMSIVFGDLENESELAPNLPETYLFPFIEFTRILSDINPGVKMTAV
jgi:hypothetical protein